MLECSKYLEIFEAVKRLGHYFMGEEFEWVHDFGSLVQGLAGIDRETKTKASSFFVRIRQLVTSLVPEDNRDDRHAVMVIVEVSRRVSTTAAAILAGTAAVV